MPKISVIIVSWNVAASLQRCLRSVFATSYPNLEVIVVDNASTEPINYPNIKLISNSHNLGFPKAVNQGLRAATGDFILILNPDTLLPKNFFIKSLEFFSSHPEAWLMGPKLVNPDGTPQGSVFPNSYQKISPPTTTPIIVKAIQGACFFMPRPTLDKVGLFTEKVFMYYEDLDYCRRIRAMGGKIYYNPQIPITHLHGLSSTQNPHSLTYLRESSRWYHGPVKYYLLTLYLWLTQKFKLLLSIFGAKSSN